MPTLLGDGREFDGASFTLNVQMMDLVTLKRDQTIECRAITWNSAGYIGGGRGSKIQRMVREALDDQLDIFLNDYYAANPKKK